MDENDGLKIAVSPVHMAAVLSDKNISEGETLSNRLFGGLGLIGGVAEMFGAGAMCVVPEPTMLTKAGCIVVGTHGLDTIQASLRQVWTGRNVSTDTYHSAVKLAETLGADSQTALHVGMTVDVAIPMSFAFAAGAVRVAAVRSGRINLAVHEALAGSTGGHTLERHIGKTAEELVARLERRPSLYATSSFRTVNEAEQLISRVIRDNSHQIEMWVKHLPPGMNAKMELERIFATQTGIMIRRGSPDVIRCYRVRLVLRFEQWHGKPYFILTAFPKA
ncbi:hypothetical protein CBW22_09360 [Pantoea sp. VS1]|uniref:RNase A-like domain-containing protein n=1 Tax=Pantoea TaxID=53335 RepID=UPI000B508AE3|nr:MULTISPECIES: RNase A-like domain-containing protein [Pantoea]OWS75984.1 hypothetical protein CBW22_09360 [Pantoea sp. VS1]QZY96702.1 hypothetical protein K7X52_00760 [Pantoea dispersa]